MYCCFFDVDGVVLDFDHGFTRTMKEFFNLDIDDDYVPESFWFSDLLTKEQVVEGWDYFIKSDEFKKENGINLKTDKLALQRLKEAAEKAKIELSSAEQTEVNLPFITADKTGPKHIALKMTRAKLEALVEEEEDG